ncbi:MAG: branched-chain amino acid ABC transporter permease [Ruminococcaceae bacterium]|nr:branched-chain amino acid ABC transporter permease [Oscillospiraceae bacterium]
MPVKTNRKRFKFKNYISYIVIALFLIISATLALTGYMNRSTQNLLTQIAYSIILAVSLNLVVGFLGELSLGHAGFMCVGAYLGCYLANLLHTLIPSKLAVLIISMIAGGLIAAVFGFIIGLPALRLKGDYLAIVTLAFGEIVRTIFKNQKVFGGALGLSTKKYGSTLFIVAFVVVLIMLAVVQNLVRSKHGRAITAIRDNEIAAKAMGINVTYYKLFVFIISAFFAGIAGVIYGHFTTPVLYSFFSYNYSIEILVMVVLGSMGSINGSIIAAALITYVNFLLQTKLSGDLAALKYLIYALILITIVIVNNAPGLTAIKERFSIKRFLSKITAKVYKPKYDPSKRKDDEAYWHRIPTKIQMDEVLSVDVTPDTTYTPDKREEK